MYPFFSVFFVHTVKRVFFPEASIFKNIWNFHKHSILLLNTVFAKNICVLVSNALCTYFVSNGDFMSITTFMKNSLTVVSDRYKSF